MLSKMEEGLTKAQVQGILWELHQLMILLINRWDYIGFEIIGDEFSEKFITSIIFEGNKLVEWKKKKMKLMKILKKI